MSALALCGCSRAPVQEPEPFYYETRTFERDGETWTVTRTANYPLR